MLLLLLLLQDLMPSDVSLSPLSQLKHLRHLIVEYKDNATAPALASLAVLTQVATWGRGL